MKRSQACRCARCQWGYEGDRCSCGHLFAAHDAARWHTCTRCVWCDEFREPPVGNRPLR